MLTSSNKCMMEVLPVLLKTEKVQTGMRQGFVMSGFLFIIVVDWIMRKTNNEKQGIRWKFMSQSTLEEYDYADDPVLLFSKQSAFFTHEQLMKISQT